MALPPSPEEKGAVVGSRKTFLSLLRIVFALFVAVLISQIKLDYIESYLYDLRVRARPTPTHSSEIELIFINPGTVQKLKGDPSARDQEELLRRLAAEKPLAVVYDFDLSQVEGSYADKNAWAQEAKALPHVYATSKGLFMKGQEGRLPPPLDAIPLRPAPKTTDTVNFGKDGVTRRMMLTYQGGLMLTPIVASLVNPAAADIKNIRGRFDFLETDQAYIDYHPAGTFPRAEFSDVAQGHFEPGRYTGKIVLIGPDLGISEEDYVSTPYKRDVIAMTRLEMQANIIDTLIRDSAPVRAPPWINWILVALTALLTVHVVLTMKPLKGLAILGATFAGACFVAYFAFWPGGYWVALAHPLLAIFLCYYFFIPYRLIVENRRSWEYYQKNRLLRQVEELKGNFISMMSHDLKTPIARIQGMTDVILADEVTLSSQQREAVDTIRSSSDDLLKFINAILNYGRIESEGVHLNLQSKDLNAILEEVIRKNEFLAKVKRIQILPELEPLFPIDVDPDLIRQVFSNLVENAIKYSPEDTKILISSEENNGKVIVQVADQGAGIPADELPNIFMKFFRSNNAKSSPIKGSGLGLYLAKYFIELHQGAIFVESSYGQGSTFTVELPLKQGKNHA